MKNHPAVTETRINIISEGTKLNGTVRVEGVARIHGILEGKLEANPGSTVILGETGVIEGGIHADRLMIDGYVRGDIEAKTSVLVSPTGRVVGNIKTPSLTIEFGAYFEGRCLMDNSQKPTRDTTNTAAQVTQQS